MEITNLMGDPEATMPFSGTLVPMNYAQFTPQVSNQSSQSKTIWIVIGIAIIVVVIFIVAKSKSV